MKFIKQNVHVMKKLKNMINPAALGLAAAMFFYFYEVILRVSPSVMTGQLMEHFHISATSLGILATSYYMSYFILQIPGGMIVDHFGVRRVITISTIICVLGTIIFSTQDNFYIALFGRLLIGIGSSCAFISCLKLATDWFKPHYFPLIAGITNTMGTLGATFSSKPLAIMVNNYGWQNVLFYLAIAGLALIPLILFFVKDKKKDTENTVSFKKSFMAIAKTKQIWLVGIIGGFLYLPITAFAELWGVPYIMKIYAIESSDASKATVMIFLGMAVGGPLSSYAAHWFKSYKNTILAGAILASILFIIVSIPGAVSYNQMMVLLFLIGILIGVELLTFTIARNITLDIYNATAMGFINGLISMVGFLFQPFLGRILDFFWSGEISESGVRIYSLENYQYAIFAVASTLVISVVMLLFVKDNYKKTA